MTRAPGQVAGAGLTGALIGAAGGAALAASFGRAGFGAIAGALEIGIGEAVTDATRTPGTAKPVAWRIVSSAAVAASIGWLVALAAPDLHLAVYGVLFGVAFAAIGFRLAKLAIGAAAGLIVGLILDAVWPEAGLAWLAALTVVAYRVPAALIYRGREQVAIMGERVSPAELEYVVPFAASSRYVGVDYLKQYADLTGADFVRNPEDVGIIANFDDLAGPQFDPGGTHPLIREFYAVT